jgi:hypothetical protein
VEEARLRKKERNKETKKERKKERKGKEPSNVFPTL